MPPSGGSRAEGPSRTRRDLPLPALWGADGGDALREVSFVSPEAIARIAGDHPGWRREDGACPACVQSAPLDLLLKRGGDAFRAAVQSVWPLDAEAAFGAIPTPLRLRADPRFTGLGVTLALVDSAFYPQPDLVAARNRIRAWADASTPAVTERTFAPSETPTWPEWDAASDWQWHGLMTSVAAAGDGHMSRGFYRGLAPDADLVLVQVAEANGRIRGESIARALRYLAANAERLHIRVVSLSAAGDPVETLEENEVDAAVRRVEANGIVVVAAAGNSGERRLVPPATAPEAITVGGIDDGNTFSCEEWRIWRSNYGETVTHAPKPEVVAPSLHVVAPILPGTALAREAKSLFERRAALQDDDPARREAEARITELKLMTPHSQHVEGSSFAAPVVAAIVATLLEANPALPPARVRKILMDTAHPVPGASKERQGAGAVDAGRAVARAVGEEAGIRSPSGLTVRSTS